MAGYLESYEISRHRQSTVENYRHWLTPWVAHTVENDLAPSNQNIKTYLDDRYSNNRTYRRVGRQIVAFVN